MKRVEKVCSANGSSVHSREGGRGETTERGEGRTESGVEHGSEVERRRNGTRYTALKTSNKINVVSGDSIRKTHRTISHTILRQNGQDSYLLHGRSLTLPLPIVYSAPVPITASVSRSLGKTLVFFILNPRPRVATRAAIAIGRDPGRANCRLA